MSVKKKQKSRRVRRRFTEEFKQEAVQMLVDGQSAVIVAERLGLSGTNILYQWKKSLIGRGEAAAQSFFQRPETAATESSSLQRLWTFLKIWADFPDSPDGDCN